MRCEHCGRNDATFHYQSVANGYVREMHLCSECAAELGFLALLPSLVSGFDLLDGTQLTPAARRALRLAEEPEEASDAAELRLDEDEERALRRQRARNALNVRLSEALEEERYEEAAQLRDELKRLEDEG